MMILISDADPVPVKINPSWTYSEVKVILDLCWRLETGLNGPMTITAKVWR